MARGPDPCDPWRLFIPAPAPGVLGTFPPGAHFPAWLALYRPLPRAWGSPELTPTLLPLPCPASPLARLTCPSSPCSQGVPGLLPALPAPAHLHKHYLFPGGPKTAPCTPSLWSPAQALPAPRHSQECSLPSQALSPAETLPAPMRCQVCPLPSLTLLTCPSPTCSQELPGLPPVLPTPAHLHKLYLLPRGPGSSPCPLSPC